MATNFMAKFAKLADPTLIFAGRMPFLPPDQQRQSTEGTDRSELERVGQDRVQFSSVSAM